MAIENEIIVAAQADRSSLPAAIEFLFARIAADKEKLALAHAALRVTDVHQGVAIECRTGDDGDVKVRALGEDIWQHGRRALVFKDERSGTGWSARMHYRPNVKTAGYPLDPGSYDYGSRDIAILAAMEWAAFGRLLATDTAQLSAPLKIQSEVG